MALRVRESLGMLHPHLPIAHVLKSLRTLRGQLRSGPGAVSLPKNFNNRLKNMSAASQQLYPTETTRTLRRCLSGFRTEFVRFFVGFLSLPDKCRPSAFNSLRAICRVCRVLLGVESRRRIGSQSARAYGSPTSRLRQPENLDLFASTIQ